jgi:hypothetical protein
LFASPVFVDVANSGEAGETLALPLTIRIVTT